MMQLTLLDPNKKDLIPHFGAQSRNKLFTRYTAFVFPQLSAWRNNWWLALRDSETRDFASTSPQKPLANQHLTKIINSTTATNNGNHRETSKSHR